MHVVYPTLSYAEEATASSTATSSAVEDMTGGECADFEVYTNARFAFIFTAGLIAIGGVISNILLLLLFAKRSCATTPPTLFPSALGLCDAIICFTYILIFAFDAMIVHLQLEFLLPVYYTYVVQIFTLAKWAQISIPYMLIFATLERLVWISDQSHFHLLRKIYSHRGRFACVLITFTVCLCVRLPGHFAMQVETYPNCTEVMRQWTTGNAEWSLEGPFADAFYIFEFHIFTCVQTVVPFAILLITNFIIVRKLRRMELDRKMQKESFDATALQSIGAGQQRSTRRQVRSAVLTMVAIVTSYLVCNTLHLILTTLEKQGSDLLKDPVEEGKSSVFHTAFSDILSFLYMFTSAIRLFIYAGVNAEIRRDLVNMLSIEGSRPIFV